MREVDILIIGSGPAGLTAALYAARGNRKTAVITGYEFGGQIATTADVENYPAFPEGIQGPELVEKMKQQAEKFGTEMVWDAVADIEFGNPFHKVKTEGGEEFITKALILTTGASPRKLGIPGEKEFTGYGVSYCATCDGAFFRDKEVIVVGGGDSAIEEGTFLTKFAKRVRVLHRRDSLRAGKLLQERAFANPKMDFVWNTVVEEVSGTLENGKKVVTATIRNLETGVTEEIPVDGVFIYVGHLPNSDLFKGKLEMDEQGYLIVDERKRTSIPGVFVGGELADPIFRQAITSAGEGCKAAMQAERYLSDLEGEASTHATADSRSLASW
jgi:thioredoxin reductase (NADPH)